MQPCYGIVRDYFKSTVSFEHYREGWILKVSYSYHHSLLTIHYMYILFNPIVYFVIFRNYEHSDQIIDVFTHNEIIPLQRPHYPPDPTRTPYALCTLQKCQSV